jgi:hypothetical protein
MQRFTFKIVKLKGGNRMEGEIRTLREWLALMPNGVQILDPDGFDRDDWFMLDRMYTRAEYNYRESHCTVFSHPVGNIPHKRWGGEPCPLTH